MWNLKKKERPMCVAKQRAAAFDKAIQKVPSEEMTREWRWEGEEIEPYEDGKEHSTQREQQRQALSRTKLSMFKGLCGWREQEQRGWQLGGEVGPPDCIWPWSPVKYFRLHCKCDVKSCLESDMTWFTIFKNQKAAVQAINWIYFEYIQRPKSFSPFFTVAQIQATIIHLDSSSGPSW